MSENLLFTEFWEHESRRVGVGIRLGDEPFYSMRNFFLSGFLTSAGSEQVAVTIDQFKGESEVYYSEDGRHVFTAGRPLGSGIGLSRNVAANAGVLELIGCPRLDTPTVFSTKNDNIFVFSKLNLKVLITSLSESPFFRRYNSERERVAFATAQKLLPAELRQNVQLGQCVVPDGEIANGSWISFNRFMPHVESGWENGCGAFQVSGGDRQQVVHGSDVPLSSGATVGIYCAATGTVVPVAEVAA